MSHLGTTVCPQANLPSRILREEMDGVLLLARICKRTKPVAGQSSEMEERGGQRIRGTLDEKSAQQEGAARSVDCACAQLAVSSLAVVLFLGEQSSSGNDRVLCVNQGWCDVFGFVDETADLKDRDIEQSLMTAGVPMEEIFHPLFDTSRSITVWSKKKGHTTLSFRCFHVFSVQHEDTFQEVLAFTFTDVTVQQRVEQALLLAHQQSRRSEQAKQCFAETDARILTNRGFLFLDQIEAVLAESVAGAGDAPPLLYACYNRSSKQLEYCPGRLVTPSNLKGRLISFTPLAEQTRWSSSATAGGSSSDSSGTSSALTPASVALEPSHFSLRVTPEHDMFVQTDDKSETRKVKAGELLTSDAQAGVCMVAVAQGGVAHSAAAGSDLAAELRDTLGLTSSLQVEAFLGLYGFWLGAAARGGVHCDPDAACFRERVAGDHELLARLLVTAGLQPNEITRRDCKMGVAEWRIVAPRWIAFFCVKASDSTQGGASSAKPQVRLKSWVLQRLHMPQLRLLLEALRSANGAPSTGEHKIILVNSCSFRDELLIALLHAGYSAFFELQRERDESAPADLWRISYTDPSSESGQRVCWPQLRPSSDLVEDSFTGRVWCVEVEHRDQLIVAQRAERDKGVVTKVSRPVICGNSMIGMVSHELRTPLTAILGFRSQPIRTHASADRNSAR